MTPPDAIPALPVTQRLRRYFEKNERRIAVASFVGGFFFDIITADRIDSWLLIGQQVAYLAVITATLLHMFFSEGRPAPDLAKLSPSRRLYYEYRAATVHFLLGALLSLYTIYFFKSSSLFVSFAFLGFLVLLLIANESSHFKALGLTVKFALLSLCVLSFAASAVPIFIGSIGTLVFLASMLAACIPIAVIYRRIRIHAPERQMQARRQILVPFGAVLAVFLALYLFRLIPPVPLSIPFIGVYHGIERTEEHFVLSHERPFWRIWHNGDQKFLAQPGDKVYVFFRIFSPTRFSDEVLLRWYWKDARGNWTLQDAIPIRIVGGRGQGFRGYGVKANYQPGAWKLEVDTTDEREIGRIYFDLQTAPAAPRSFRNETH